MKVPPVKYLVKIKDMHLAAFFMYWIEYGKPCNILLRKPNTHGFTAIILVVDNDDSVFFLSTAKERISLELRKME